MVDCQHRGYWTEGLSGEVVAADSGSSYRALKKLLRPGVARENGRHVLGQCVRCSVLAIALTASQRTRE
jgi:hypothetical protein